MARPSCRHEEDHARLPQCAPSVVHLRLRGWISEFNCLPLVVEKYGLLIGGADTHRYDLSSMVMLKVLHIPVGILTPLRTTSSTRLAASPPP